jgi:hypothetical protein
MSSKVKDFLVKYKKTILIVSAVLLVFQLFGRYDYRSNGAIRIDRLTSQQAHYCQSFGEYRSTCRLPVAAPVIVPIDGTPEPVLESTPQPQPTMQVIPVFDVAKCVPNHCVDAMVEYIKAYPKHPPIIDSSKGIDRCGTAVLKAGDPTPTPGFTPSYCQSPMPVFSNAPGHCVDAKLAWFQKYHKFSHATCVAWNQK